MRSTKSFFKKSTSNRTYELHGSPLQNVAGCKYLGVIIHSKVSFRTHIDMTVKKAKQNECILKTFNEILSTKCKRKGLQGICSTKFRIIFTAQMFGPLFIKT